VRRRLSGVAGFAGRLQGRVAFFAVIFVLVAPPPAASAASRSRRGASAPSPTPTARTKRAAPPAPSKPARISPVPSGATPRSPTPALVTATPPASLAERLEDARRRRRLVEKELGRLQAQQQTTLTEIDRLDLELRLAGHKLEEAEIETRRANAALDQTLRRIKTLETGLALTKPKVAKSVIALNKLGELSYARMLLSVQNPADLLRGYRLVAHVAEQDRGRLTDFRRDIATMQSLRADLKERTAESIARRERVTQARRDLTTERARTEERLDEIADRRETQEQLAREARDQEESLVRLLETAAASPPESAPASPIAAREAAPDSPAAGWAAPGPDVAGDDGTGGVDLAPSEPERPFARMKGDLPWPLSGGITERFGLQRHPRFDTITVQQGVEIQGATNAPVRAVGSGRVVFADSFAGYGLLVIVDHGDRQHTLYARLGELAVRAGELVTRGDVVGRLPDTQLTRRGLHFEVRIQGKPENPLTWLADR
jgi:septal ring factor EnvC (AmiA/AmiB activator)